MSQALNWLEEAERLGHPLPVHLHGQHPATSIKAIPSKKSAFSAGQQPKPLLLRKNTLSGFFISDYRHYSLPMGVQDLSTSEKSSKESVYGGSYPA